MKQSWKYHKIMSVYKRDEQTKKFIIGECSTPEIKYLWDNEWVFTEKVDGTNIRVLYDGKESVFAGRSDDAQLYVPLIYKLDSIFKTLEQRKKLESMFRDDVLAPGERNIVFYGEGYGAKIQKGGENYIADAVDFVLFDVCVDGLYLERENVDDIANKLGIRSVPIIGHGTLTDAIEMTKKGFKSQWGDFIAEGIVARPRVEIFTRLGERVITKVKHRDFLP